MESNIKIIADHLVANLKDVANLAEKEIKDESFRLSFYLYPYSITFSCSLHHLDLPWKIIGIIKDREVKIGSIQEVIKNSSETINTYEISPMFLSNVKINSKILAERIKTDLLKAMDVLKGV